MALVRGHHSFDDQYTQIPNAWLRDPRLSLGAKGLLAQIMSHAAGWRISQESLAKDNGVGKDAIRTLITELMNAGYLVRSDKRERNEKGFLGGYTYTTAEPMLDQPTLAEPTLDYPTLDEPTLDNPPHKKNILKEQQVKEQQVKEIRSFEQADFDDFWRTYPRKTGKAAALAAYAKALKQATAYEINHGAAQYRDDPNRLDQYTKHPTTWLNAGCWDDDPLPAKESKVRAKESRQDLARQNVIQMHQQSQAKAIESNINFGELL